MYNEDRSARASFNVTDETRRRVDVLPKRTLSEAGRQMLASFLDHVDRLGVNLCYELLAGGAKLEVVVKKEVKDGPARSDR